ncbi:hypothetical protein Riv7116_4763 [Rivularia sp. PCC 7116]|uniref:hypothetical protein n=1 Tax=Rivularia sp. PCC 7116 TaxID=373994 RepID=UPI00029ED32F|nr:hypothetical protein [Rivularia sp. PCC 7116]AFY57176.1 hypothetical protein Riv7116_4763 [Rivularia sp. PCC 7116]
MTPQDFLDSLASAQTDSQRLAIFAQYLDTTALDNATTRMWRKLSYSGEIEMSLKNLAFHLEELSETLT